MRSSKTIESAASGPRSSESGPSHAWTFDGDLAPSSGERVTLKADGPVEQGTEAVAFDGATSSLLSQEPGPVDPTESFTATAWVSLRPPRLIGGTQ